MTNKELYQLTHPEYWPHGSLLPVVRRGGNPVRNVKDAGIVTDVIYCVMWYGVYLGDAPYEGEPIEYPTPEALLAEWEID